MHVVFLCVICHDELNKSLHDKRGDKPTVNTLDFSMLVEVENCRGDYKDTTLEAKGYTMQACLVLLTAMLEQRPPKAAGGECEHSAFTLKQ